MHIPYLAFLLVCIFNFCNIEYLFTLCSPCWGYHFLVFATGPNYGVGCWLDSTRNRTMATSLSTWQTRTIGHGRVSPPKTRHFKFTIFPLIQYLSADRTTTWSVRKLCTFGRSFSTRCQNFDQPVFVESLSTTREYRWQYGVISQWFNQYWSDCKSESGRWKSA